MSTPWSRWILVSVMGLSAWCKGAGILADSVLDWEQSLLDDGRVTQGEFGWEYGYISNYAGMDGIYFGWHPGSFYWRNNSGIIIYWPDGQTPPDEAWGIGGDSSGCRPPMNWKDGVYPWADAGSDHWAAARRWTSDYAGYVGISGTVGRYFPLSLLTGWDVTFFVAVNAATLADPVIYRLEIPWNDETQHAYTIRDIRVKPGDTISFYVNAQSWNANKSYIRLTAVISEAPFLTGDINQDLYVGFGDYSILASEWRRTGCDMPDFCGGADLDRNGQVDLSDLAILAGLWMECNDPNPPCGYIGPWRLEGSGIDSVVPFSNRPFGRQNKEIPDRCNDSLSPMIAAITE